MSNEVQQLNRTAQDVARALLQQPEFFDFHREDMPPGETSLPRVNRYSGERSDDELTNLHVGAMRLLGMSDRAIERECAIDRRTIPHRLKWLEDTKRIPAQKDRLARVVGEIAEKSGLVLNGLLDLVAAGRIDVELAAMIKSVATTHGISVEKLQLVTGGPTEIIETRSDAGRAEVEAFWRSAAIEVSPEPQSTDSPSSAVVFAQPLETIRLAI